MHSLFSCSDERSRNPRRRSGEERRRQRRDGSCADSTFFYFSKRENRKKTLGLGGWEEETCDGFMRTIALVLLGRKKSSETEVMVWNREGVDGVTGWAGGVEVGVGKGELHFWHYLLLRIQFFHWNASHNQNRRFSHQFQTSRIALCNSSRCSWLPTVMSSFLPTPNWDMYVPLDVRADFALCMFQNAVVFSAVLHTAILHRFLHLI